MILNIPVTVTHPNGQTITTVVAVDDAHLDWFPDGEGRMMFDLDQAEEIAYEVVMDDLTFTFGAAVSVREALGDNTHDC